MFLGGCGCLAFLLALCAVLLLFPPVLGRLNEKHASSASVVSM
jgi:hypothetical protein